jgi:hypothetical protein
LSELVIALSNLTGLWDALILSTIFVISWIVLRVSEKEVALILGWGFDAVIPLQYYCECESTVDWISGTKSKKGSHPVDILALATTCGDISLD